ncbi:ABC-2 transporter permease [Pullulanibacillus sp. KACC 23026]|uniref:ABC-2 transporter permease n=1 Tax=Pullulanibacillus sp. KACC 23026 TaxID=3028315 RepID=UPI0023AF86F8|nr:ABC-2 transporter permease [Pullulanibacillus sp. KACC 23026]WEG12360.1 ABC-2 transporter permease [Pullulanibacillus sp. KACC 23026]
MFNLVMKDIKLGVNPMFFVFPFLTGALMLVPGWIYFIVPLYFCWITVPNMFGGFKTQNDLIFTTIMPVDKKDIVRARVAVIVILELLHIVIAMIYGMITIRLYPKMIYYFFAPHMGFWGLCFVMLAIFNVIFISMYYKTAYKHGQATTVAVIVAMLFAGFAQWLGIQNSRVADVFNGSGAHNVALQASILIIGIVIFIAFTLLAYRIAYKRFLQVEIQ